MKAVHFLRAWKSILSGRAPSLSIEITRECPLHCPGCYAYEAGHVGGTTTLRDLADHKGDELIRGVLALVDRLKPLHVSLVGGDPLVRWRELETLIPQLTSRGIHVQVVTSAFRPLPPSWVGQKGLTVSVSVDGLAPEHDARRSPATYERILKHIAGQRITIHCTVTAQMTQRTGYLDEFLEFWSARDEVERVWFSLFTPQAGANPPERLTVQQRGQVVRDLQKLREKYEKADLPPILLDQFLRPPASPAGCIFAQTTETISADLKTRITPCQFGGVPDCGQCGCYASMGLAAVGERRLGGLIPVSSIFRASLKIGSAVARASARDRLGKMPGRRQNVPLGHPVGRTDLIPLPAPVRKDSAG